MSPASPAEFFAPIVWMSGLVSQMDSEDGQSEFNLNVPIDTQGSHMIS